MRVRSLIKKIALILAGVAALTAIGFGVTAIVEYTKEDLKTISPSFEVGNLGADGKFVDDETTLYTKEAFACNGLQVKLDFDNQINYQIYYYDDLDNFIESTQVLSESYSGGAHDSYARLVITPTNDEDGKISWTEKISYPKQMTVKVNKTQDSQYFNVFGKRLRANDDISTIRYCKGEIVPSVNGGYVFKDSESYVRTSELLKVKGGSTLNMTYQSSKIFQFFLFEFKEVDGQVIFVKKSARENTVVLDKSTNFVLYVINEYVKENDETVYTSFSDEFLHNFYEYINITK